MKKKRLLSLLLAALLVSSSVPMTAITADTASGDTALDMDKWGNVTVTSPEKASDARPGDTDGSYIRLVGGLSTGQTYTQTANIKKGAAYTVSFWTRTAPRLNAPASGETGYADGNVTARIYFNGSESSPATSFVGFYDNSNRVRPHLSSEWTYMSATYTAAADANYFKIAFNRFWNGEDAGVIDIDGISVVSSGKELYTGNGTWTDSGSGSGGCKLEVIETNDEFYRFNAGTENTSFKYTASDVIQRGVYHVSGEFKILEYDYKKPGGVLLSVTNKGKPLKTTAGDDGLLVNTTWKKDSFYLEVAEPVSMSDIVFALDGAYTLDFKNISFKKVSSYSDDYATTDGKPAILTKDQRDGNTDGEYLHVGGPLNTGIQYSTSSYQLVEGAKYRLTFWARTAPLLNNPNVKDGNVTIRVSINNTNIYSTVAASCVNLTSEWKQFTFTIDQSVLAAGQYYQKNGLLLRIFRYWDAEDSVAFDIDDIQLTLLDASGNPTGDNIISSAAAWSAYNASGTGATVETAQNEEFYRFNAGDGNTSFHYTGSDMLEAGIYHISGEFKILEHDYSKPDGVLLTAANNGTPIKTTAGNDGILIGTAWKKDSFFLEVTEPVAKSDIVFTLDGAYTLDFKEIEFYDATDEYFGEWLTGEGAKLQVVDDGTESYYVIAKPSDGNTSVKYNGEGTLTNGKWHISAKFRLSENNTVNVSAKAGANTLNAYLGASMTNAATSFTVTDDGWVTAVFVVNVTDSEGLAKNTISFEFDKQISVQACEFKFECADDLYSEEWVSNGDAPALVIDDGRPGDTDGKYIHVSELNMYTPASGLAYYDANRSFDPEKTYRLTFWMRTLPQVGADSVVSSANNMNVRVYVGDAGPGAQNGIEIIPKALSLDEGYFSQQALLVGEWTKYSLTFNISAKPNFTSFRLSFYRFYDIDDSLPFDIDGLSVVEIDPATGEAISEELVTKDYLAYQTFGVAQSEELTSADYTRATAKAGVDTVLSSTGTTVYPAGIYHITGSFRLTEYDRSKLVYDSNFVTENNISALLTAAVGSDSIGAIDGADVNITNEWQDVTFLYAASKSFSASDLAFTVDGALAIDFKDIEIIDANSLYLENWAAGDGSFVGVVNDVREGDTDNTYIHIGGAMSTGASYSDPSTNLVDGARYKLTFWARSTPFVNSPADDSGAGNVTIRTSVNSTNINGTVQKSSVNLTNGWKQYTFIFSQADLATGTYYKKDGLLINIYRYWFNEDGVPYDLDGVALVQIDENDNPISENLLKSEIKWGSYSGAPVEEISLEEFYRVPAPATDVTSIECLDDIVLEPGIYHIGGKFRLPTFDFNGSSAQISAYAGGVQLTTKSGSTSSGVGADWTEVAFVLNTMVPINMNTISLMLNDAVDLDFYDLQITLVERHVSLSSVNTGVIVTLLLLKEKAIEAAGYLTTWNANSVALETVDAVLDEATGKVGAEGGADANTFIRFANRDSNFDKLIYKNDNATLKPGAYKVSFWARTLPYINAPAENNAVGLRMYNDAECISHISIRRSSQGSYYSHNAIQLNPNWTYYSFVYSVTKETPMVYSFNGTASGYGIAPIDIDGFSVVAVDSGSNKPITGENLAVDSNKLKSASAAGWTTTGEGIGVYESVLETYVETEHLHANAVKDQNTEIRCASSRKLAVGTYYVTAKVRLATLDYAKYTFESSSNLSADDNKAVLTASLKGAALKTPDGAESVTVTSEWTDVIFVLDVNEEVSLRSLAITADSSVALDFDYINVDTKIKKEIAVDVSEAGDWSNGDLPPLPPIADGNYLEGALDADKLPYWERGTQTLTALTDEEGNPYFAATNIKNNTLGFTYNPGYTLKPGLYKLSVDIRTSNEGENGIVRMLVNDQYKCYSTAISNEWRTVQMAFEVKSSEYLTVKLYGGLIASSVQDYEFKNLTLVDVVEELEGQNLVAAGTFDDETALENWTVQSDAKLTVHKDGYLQITERAAAICGGVLKVDLGFKIPAGTKFKVSYDIRAGKPDTTFKVRTFIGSVGLNVEDYAFEWRHYEYYITNEWEHVESTYVSVGDDYLKFIVQGGVDVPDNGDIDIDNIVIEIVR